MTHINTRMPSGFAGDVTRAAVAVLEPCLVGDTDLAHGAPAKLVDGELVPLEAGDVAADIYGFVARSYPSQGGAGSTADNVAPAGSVVDVLRSGYMAVPLAVGAGSKGGLVYARISAASGSVGDIEAALVADETVAIDATFMGAADADGVVEIAYNI
ncbi:hypothetical protein [Pseudodesulfovibrio sp.]|uniref:structural cement protein Gp24 n=1 Tax=Pseudodesulfovibrio sp. TaxID=2035812 RepID=UPI00260CE328|nr:hypothetical protein [Pseudodesulfovibrio sp.]MDD3310960.1 hypothetical protein [Pseudodesulfovibrio sp.]